MKTLASSLKHLEESKFLHGFIYKDRLFDVKLLENGKLLQDKLIRKWKEASNAKQKQIFLHTDSLCNSQEECELEYLIKDDSTILKEVMVNDGEDRQVSFLNFSKSQQFTKLITDKFLKSKKLEYLYNYQRERKIWWMLYSSNPSHYHLKLNTIENDFDVEHITHISLNNTNLVRNLDLFKYKKVRRHTDEISVIRSTINLEVAVAALLFDAYFDSHTDSLLINRLLAPYQCAVICNFKENYTNELEDLRCHVANVILEAGVYLYGKNSPYIKSNKALESELSFLDNIGIPYVIILEPMSLDYGFMKLRNRDTLLEETVHISDLPDYLLKILK